MTERTITTPISRGNFNSAIEAFLRQIGVVAHNEDVTNVVVECVDWNLPNPVTLTLTIKKQEEEKIPEPIIIPDDEDMPELPSFLDRRTPEVDVMGELRNRFNGTT